MSGVISGSGAVTQIGSGTLTLAGGNTYTGATTIIAGTLVLANSSALQNSTAAVNAAANSLTFAGTGTFNLGGLSGSSSLALSDTAGPITLQVGRDNANTIYAGVLSGSGSLTKTGSGTLTLSNANTFLSPTSVSGGQLTLANQYALRKQHPDHGGQ